MTQKQGLGQPKIWIFFHKSSLEPHKPFLETKRTFQVTETDSSLALVIDQCDIYRAGHVGSCCPDKMNGTRSERIDQLKQIFPPGSSSNFPLCFLAHRQFVPIDPLHLVVWVGGLDLDSEPLVLVE